MKTIVPPPLRRPSTIASPCSEPRRRSPAHRRGLAVFLALASALVCARPVAAQLAGTPDSLNANIAGTAPTQFVKSVVTQADGKILIGGNFATIGGVARGNIARFNADGTLDTAFDVWLNGTVFCITIQPDDKILVSGDFTLVKPAGITAQSARNYLLRLNPDGTLDPAFNPSANNTVSSMALQADGNIVLGGYFTTLRPGGAGATIPYRYMARVDPDGVPDPEFSYNPQDFIYCVAVQDDGKILVGGKFVNGDRQYIVRINTDLSLDANFVPLVNGPVHCLAVQPDGRILLGGSFTAYRANLGANPVIRNRLLRLTIAGLLDNSFNPNSNGTVECLAIQADRRILLGGTFTTLQPNVSPSATARVGIARINTDASVDVAFNPRASDDANSIALQADGMIVTGGYFTTFGSGTPRKFFARLFNSPGTQAIVTPSPTQVVWERSGALPEVEHVTLEQSTNNGTDWTPLGPATRVTGTANWEVNTLDPLPAEAIYRARGKTTAGSHGTGYVMFTAIPTQTPLQEWNVTWFGSPDSAGNAALDADPNGNGIPNLLEYALGGDPVGETAGVAVLPALSTDPVTGALKLTFSRTPARTDLTLTVQTADDVNGPWEDAARSTEGNAFGLLLPEYAIEETGEGDTRTVIATDKPSTGGLRRFMRLKATTP